MLELHETFQIVDGYDKRKDPAKLTVRKLTLEEIKHAANGTLANWDYGQEFLFIDNRGQARRCRVASKLKTWKRDPERFECTFKYGLNEWGRWNTQEMLGRLLIEV